MTAKETLDLISKQWATTNDIKKLANIGNTKALNIKHLIQNKIIESNKMLPNSRLIPMKDVVDYLGIDIEYLKSIQKIMDN